MTEANNPAESAAELWRLDPVRLDWDTVLLRDPAYRDPVELKIAGMTMGVGGIAALVGIPATAFLALLTDWFSWWWCILAAGTLIVLGLTGAATDAASDRLRSAKATLTGAQLKALPTAVRRPLARGILAIEDIKSGRAFREQYLGELALGETAWRMAQMGLRAGELSTAQTELLADADLVSDADRAAAGRAQHLFEGLVADLERDAAALGDAAAAARRLSGELENSVARELAAAERDRISHQQLERRHRLDAAVAAIEASPALGSPDTADLAVARASAYTEVMRLGAIPLVDEPERD